MSGVDDLTDTPHFITGAPRSGTKILRDTLDEHPRIESSDHPLESIWNYGHDDSNHEAYTPDDLTEAIKTHVRESFQPKLSGDRLFVEKNVVHSLRVPYVHQIFPDARFIHIMRDGRDAVASAVERWKHPTDWRYYLLSGKGFELSPRDILYYGAKHVYQLVKKWLSGQESIDTWGPRFPGIEDLHNEEGLLETCITQWKQCVTSARGSANVLASDQYLEVKYEELMNSPEDEIKRVVDFFQLDSMDPLVKFANQHYRTSSIGRWREKEERIRRQLDQGLTELLNDLQYEA